MDLGLAGKKVLVTGGSRGIGLSIVKSFLREGAYVALVARDAQNLQAVSADLMGLYGSDRILAIPADVTQSLMVQNLVRTVRETWDKLDILIANVGDGRSSPEPLPNAEQFQNTWNTNFLSAELIVRETLPLINDSEGNIVFVSSIAGLESIGAPTDYSVAKAAIIAFAKNLARKSAPKIRVNVVAPGNVYFEGGSWHQKLITNPERVEAMLQSQVPMKRFGRPDEIADSVLFLASDRAGFITGSCLTVDGGQTVRLI